MSPLSSRGAGVLLHPTSLPSGRLDEDAEAWIDWLAEAGFSLWQVLPLGVPQANLSPYMCLSSFALNPALMGEKAVKKSSLSLELADFLDWYRRQQHWLDDYALFRVLKDKYEGQAWYEWPECYRQRDVAALERAHSEHRHAITAIGLQQYTLFSRWQALRGYARERGISIFGDLPIFVALDSADVWAHQDCFLLDEQGQPQWVAGVPPDYFSETGQRWGNPQYDWQALAATEFNYWVRRIGYHFECFDLLRIDHFRGLQASWMIPADSEGAAEGHWQEVPGEALLTRLREALGELPLVAEDLGTITPEVDALRKKFELPGMAVLQFAWDGSPDNPHLPANITPDRVVYTGTHDNDTTLGWFNSLDEAVQRQVMQQIGIERPEQIGDAFIDAALNSAAMLAVFPLQDLLGLGAEARMNIPGTDQGNWRWQYADSDLSPALAAKLAGKLSCSARMVKTDG